MNRVVGRRVQFTLSAVFLVVTVVCVIIGRESSIQHAQWRAASKLSNDGALVAWDSEYSEYWSGDHRIFQSQGRSGISGNQSPATKWFQRIVLVDSRAEWPHRSVKPSALEREHIRLLQAFPGIRAIALDGRTVGAEELEAIGTLHSLEQLWIDEGTRLKSRDMTLLRGLSNLRCLTIRSAPIGDDACFHLSKIRQLKELDLSQCDVSDEGVAHLRGHPSLRSLILQDNGRVTDSALRELVEVRSLRQLNLVGTDVSYEGVKEFALTRECIWIDIGASIGSSSILDDAGNVRIISW